MQRPFSMRIINRFNVFPDSKSVSLKTIKPEANAVSAMMAFKAQIVIHRYVTTGVEKEHAQRLIHVLAKKAIQVLLVR